MDRMVTADIGGKTVYLNYSVSVMFDMVDKYGSIQTALETIAKDNTAGLEAVQWFAVQMANDGELCRRELGYDKGEMLTNADISSHMHPLEYGELKAAVVQAITAGYRREVTPENDEIDLGLAELNAKKKKNQKSERSTTTSP